MLGCIQRAGRAAVQKDTTDTRDALARLLHLSPSKRPEQNNNGAEESCLR